MGPHAGQGRMGTSGRIARVALLAGGGYLSLAEVEVFCAEGPPPGKVFHRGDADDNGQLQLTDAIRILGFLFLGGVPPEAPGPPPAACGPDPQGSTQVGCEGYLSC
ncbi:MAG: hypothetical protein HY721_22710 [Planctomycetes bacterium]|nr:hypothetical protein [Planctomycetota bacterium]